MVWTIKPPAGTQLDFTNPITNGLHICLMFNENSGTRVNDISGNNINGTINGMSSTPTSGWVTGRNGQSSLAFDGIKDFIDVTPHQLSGLTNFTIETWIYPNPLIANERFIFALGNTQIRSKWGQFMFGFGYDEVTLPQILGTWHHVVFSADTTGHYLYVNGVKNSGLGTNTISGNGLTIGAQLNALFFSGIIDLVRVWNKTITDSEAQTLYVSPYSMFLDSLCPPIICNLSVS